MAVANDATERETRVQPNLTPMIDVVFQLIIVFLCSMKFRTLDMKVEANLPRDAGGRPTHAVPDVRPRAEVRLRRAPGAEGTRILLLGAPLGTAGEGAWSGLQERLAALHGRDPEIRGEIDADPDVPHGDVMRTLDAFVGAAYSDVRFRGTRLLPGR